MIYCFFAANTPRRQVGVLHLPNHSQRSLFILLLLLVYFVAGGMESSFAQVPIRKLKDFPIQEVSSVSIDRLGNFYLVFKKASIKKYDTDGNFMHEFRNPDSVAMTLLEPWNPLRIFVYGQEHQQILILDHSLVQIEKISLDPSLAIRPILASPTPNGNYWLLDEADFSLKKVDSKSTRVLLEMNIKLIPAVKPNFTFLREYQNQLFLIDQQTGIEMLSVTGKPIRTFQIKNLSYLGFLGQEIYFLENGKIKLFDLYSEEQRELKTDPLAQFVLLTDERMVVVKKSTVEVWEFKP